MKKSFGFLLIISVLITSISISGCDNDKKIKANDEVINTDNNKIPDKGAERKPVRQINP